MRVVAIPAPLPTKPSTTVIVGIELPTTAAARARRIELWSSRSIRKEKRGPVRSSRPTRQLGKDGVAVDPYRFSDRPAARRVSASRGRRRRGHIDRQRVPRRVRTDVCGGARGGRPLPWCSELDCRDVGGPAPRVLALVPLATNELARGTAVSGQLPIKVSSMLRQVR